MGNSIKYEKTAVEQTTRIVAGTKYYGYMHPDKETGSGKIQFATGTIYIGDFEDGVPHGGGQLICKNGQKYDGEFKKGSMCGLGVLTDESGTNLKGEWQNGKRNGKFTSTSRDGKVTELVYEYGKLVWSKKIQTIDDIQELILVETAKLSEMEQKQQINFLSTPIIY